MAEKAEELSETPKKRDEVSDAAIKARIAALAAKRKKDNGPFAPNDIDPSHPDAETLRKLREELCQHQKEWSMADRVFSAICNYILPVFMLIYQERIIYFFFTAPDIQLYGVILLFLVCMGFNIHASYLSHIWKKKLEKLQATEARLLDNWKARAPPPKPKPRAGEGEDHTNEEEPPFPERPMTLEARQLKYKRPSRTTVVTK